VPLKAIVDGETIIGPELSTEEWTSLSVRHRNGLPIRMNCCGAPGHLRISKKGTRHFYHASESGCKYEEESKEHLEIKYQIFRICKSEHWDTHVEFPAPDRTWISDVCAVKDGRKIVFEVQISTISPYELEERDRKYRNEGIESYWLLDNFLERSKDFKSWFDDYLSEEDERPVEKIPSLDYSLFATGPENHIFIAKGIRSIGLRAKKPMLFTTNNPEISLSVWVGQVLNGNYRNYLEETSAAFHRKRRLKNLAAPALIRFEELYHTIIRDETYRKKVDSYYRIIKTDKTIRNGKSLQIKFDELYSEIDWLVNEYRSCMSESSGLFTWKKNPGYTASRPFFRLESEANVRKLQERVQMISQWEASFKNALGGLEREFSPCKNDRK